MHRAGAALLFFVGTATAAAQVAPARPPAAVRAPAMVVSAAGAPRTVQFARATVPSTIPPAAAVRYAIVATGSAPLVTRQLTGTLPPGGAGRGVLVSFSIPARSLAGMLPVATVRYTTANGLTSTTAVHVRVTPVRAMSMAVLQSMRGARPGETLDIGYRVSNLGNVVDTARLTLQLPYGWTVKDGADSVAVAIRPGSAVERTARVTVGQSASTGSYTVRIAARIGGQEAATDNAFVSVATPRDASGTGPVLTTSMLTASGTGGGRTVLTAMSLRGRIVGDVGITADVHQHTTLDETNRYRLSTLGHFPQPPTVTLYNRHYRGTVGGVGANLSDITGVNAGGRGASLTYDGDRRAVEIFGASAVRSVAAEDEPSGALYGGRVEQRVGPVWLTGTAAHLDEGSAAGRRLDVAGAGVIIPSAIGSGDLTTEMAWRRHRDGEGLGMLAQYVLTEQFTRVQLRAMRAPGGASAFAQSGSSFSGIASHRLSPRLSLGTFGSYDTDESSVRGSTQSHAASVTPRIQLTSRFFIAPDVGTSGHRTRTPALAFGQREVRSGVQVGMQLGDVALMAGGGGAQVTRDAQADTLPAATITTLRTHASGGITYATTRFGALSILADVAADRTSGSPFPRQNQVGARIDRLPVYLTGGFRLLANGAVHRMDWYGDRPGVVQLRGDLTAELPYGFNVSVAADRNPLVTLPGGGGWTTSIRAEHRAALRAPAFLQPGHHRGVVYRDLDGDGRRGRNEGGAPGIVLQRGTESVSTDAGGRFRLGPAPAGSPGQLQVDPRSLPAGWVQSATPTAGDARRAPRDIPIVPTTHVRVQLAVSREDLGASGSPDMRGILVIARDSLGRAWLATADTASDVQGFPALPPGLYTLEVDPSGSGAALTVRSMPEPFRVGAEREARTIRVELATRRVRMFRARDAAAPPQASTPAPAPAPVTTPVAPKRSTPAPVIPRSGKDPATVIPRSGKDPATVTPRSTRQPAAAVPSAEPPMIIPRFGKDAFRPAVPADSMPASRKPVSP